jgi:FtsP/CotA-like multicopper oxidase with cupredoxin domain
LRVLLDASSLRRRVGPGVRFLGLVLLVAGQLSIAAPLRAQHDDHASGADSLSGPAWRMPPMRISMPMLPPLMGQTPDVSPWLPGEGVDPDELPEARPAEVHRLADGDTLELEAGLVRREIRGRTFVMYGYNAQYPGPLIRVNQGATITVVFRNSLEKPSTIHWHGLRLDNRFDGVPDVTQEAVEPGGSFVYSVRFPDAGLYWYHPHVRSDSQQDLGLYGNMLVDAERSDYWNPVNREEVVVLDDLLIDDGGLFPYGDERTTHALMGRFGNVMLVNGSPSYELEVDQGEVVRFLLTNVSNTRTYNLVLEGAETKIVGADVGLYEQEEMVGSVVIGPAQRYIVEALFEEPGTYALTNSIQAVDHFRGEFVPRVDTLGSVRVAEAEPEESHVAEFESLREGPGVAEDLEAFREHFDRPVDHELELTVRAGDLPRTIVNVMSMDTLYAPPVEWNDVMPMMNYLSTGDNLTWILRDPATGNVNEEIHWTFTEGDVARIRIHNLERSFHPMHHPIHLHGQRFLVLSRDGVPNDNLVWRDTAIVPVGSTFDILVDASNPGDWLLHCHISEHIESGMKMVFTVEPADEGAP